MPVSMSIPSKAGHLVERLSSACRDYSGVMFAYGTSPEATIGRSQGRYLLADEC